MASRKNRINEFDLIRLFACLCVITVHFNASISMGFQLPNGIVSNHYFDNRVYLGDIGVCLYFILSGATQMLTYKEGDLVGFYKKRFLSLYPMFWISYLAATVLDLFIHGYINVHNPVLISFSLLGIDGYLCSKSLLPYDFYKVGEWFLGCILLLYVFFPLLHHSLKKRSSSIIITLAACLLYVHFIKEPNIGNYMVTTNTFYMRIPELLFGMFFVKYKMWEDNKLFVITIMSVFSIIVSWGYRMYMSPLTLSIILSIFLFCVLMWVSKGICAMAWILPYIVSSSSITYPVFLVHHWLISKAVLLIDLESLTFAGVALIYICYLIASVLIAFFLLKAGQFVKGCIVRYVPDKCLRYAAALFAFLIVFLPAFVAFRSLLN